MTELVAVTGATGRIGAPLVQALQRVGQPVRALSRRPQPSVPGVEWVTGDLLDPVAVTALVEGVETVFHAGGQLDGPLDVVERSLVEGTANVVRAAKSVRLVHVSSLVVLDTGSTGTPNLIDETAPLEPCPERRGVYTRAKSAAEALVRAAAVEQDVVIARPGLVVGKAPEAIPPSVGLSFGALVMLIGPGDALLPVVHTDDVASGLILVAAQAVRGGVIHLVDPMPVTRAQLLHRISAGSTALSAGGIVLRLARWVAHGRGSAANSAYRLLAAGTAHRWSCQRAQALGWHSNMLGPWLAGRSDAVRPVRAPG